MITRALFFDSEKHLYYHGKYMNIFQIYISNLMKDAIFDLSKIVSVY